MNAQKRSQATKFNSIHKRKGIGFSTGIFNTPVPHLLQSRYILSRSIHGKHDLVVAALAALFLNVSQNGYDEACSVSDC